MCRYEFDMLREQMYALSLEALERNAQRHRPGNDPWLVHNIPRGSYPTSGDQSGRRTPTVMIHTAPMGLTYWSEFYIYGWHAVTSPRG